MVIATAALVLSRAMKAALIAEQGLLGNDEPSNRLNRPHFGGPLQRDLAGDPHLTPPNNCPRVMRGQEQRGLRSCGVRVIRYRGARTITTWRPSNLASCSTLAN